MEAIDVLKWSFSQTDSDELVDFFDEHGFVGIDDIFTDDEVQALDNAFHEAVANGHIDVKDEKLFGCNDAIFVHPLFQAVAEDARIYKVVERLLGTAVELQHAKINCKPYNDEGGGKVLWHQDYPFFPHTNHDLVAVVIHLDAEDEDSGPLHVVSGSHKRGVLSHCNGETFAYTCTEPLNPEGKPECLLTGKAGHVTIHHGLTLHASAPARYHRPRRLFVLEYRAVDNIQLAGPLWKCSGHPISPNAEKGYARFMDGTRVELRGKGGRLYDLYGRLAPNA